jgi:hypothetical protein
MYYQTLFFKIEYYEIKQIWETICIQEHQGTREGALT